MLRSKQLRATAQQTCLSALYASHANIAPLCWMQDPIYLRIFKVLFFVIQPQITGPLYVRLAFHDAATWNKNATNKGGCATPSPTAAHTHRLPTVPGMLSLS